jgi:hypothetical protein
MPCKNSICNVSGSSTFRRGAVQLEDEPGCSFFEAVRRSLTAPLRQGLDGLAALVETLAETLEEIALEGHVLEEPAPRACIADAVLVLEHPEPVSCDAVPLSREDRNPRPKPGAQGGTCIRIPPAGSGRETRRDHDEPGIVHEMDQMPHLPVDAMVLTHLTRKSGTPCALAGTGHPSFRRQP